MDKIERYRKFLCEVLKNYATERGNPRQSDPVETQLLFDRENDYYQVVRVGWKDGQQVFTVIFHFDIKDGKIWLQRNISDYDIVGDLEAQGVPKGDIVLAFHSPYMRQFIPEYAAA